MKAHAILCCISMIATSWTAAAQEPMSEEQAAMMAAFEKAATPGAQHARLAETVGDWTAVVQTWMAPDTEPVESRAEATRRMSLDGRVLEEHWTGDMMGQTFEGIGRTGYDNVTERYWTTWTDSMSTGLMVSYGQWDDDLGGFEFVGEYSDPLSGEMVWNRTVASWPEEGREIMEMFERRDGAEVRTMRIEMTRR